MQQGKNLIACIFIAVKYNWEISIIALDIFLDNTQLYSLYVGKPLAVTFHNFLALGNFLTQMTQIANSHSRLELVHFGIAAYVLHRFRAVNAEVLHIVQQLHPIIILEADRAALDGIKNLCSVEAEHGGVPKAGRGHAFIPHAESVGSIVDNLQSMLLGDGLNGFHVAEVPVNMYRHNRRSAVGNQTFDSANINGVVLFVHITEDRHQPIAHNGMGGGGEGKGSSNDLPPLWQVQRRNGVFQCQMAVGVKRYMGHAQVAFQLGLQFLMFYTHISQPMGVPQFFDFTAVFLKCGHGGTGDENLFLHITSLLLLTFDFPFPFSYR